MGWTTLGYTQELVLDLCSVITSGSGQVIIRDVRD